MQDNSKKIIVKCFGWTTLIFGILILVSILMLLRLSIVTDHFYHALVKDPVRNPPAGNNIVSPADGTVIYVKRIKDGILPEVVKKDVPMPLSELIKDDSLEPPKDGYLIGVYMNLESVHITRAPIDAKYVKQIVFNGPHMLMTEQEKTIILTKLIPGLVTFKKLLGMEPFSIEKHGDYILKSARETSVFKDIRNTHIYVIRIADYWVGNILTWIQEGQDVKKGQKIGMITWGSQVDICFENSNDLKIKVKEGDYVYAGETIIAEY